MWRCSARTYLLLRIWGLGVRLLSGAPTFSKPYGISSPEPRGASKHIAITAEPNSGARLTGVPARWRATLGGPRRQLDFSEECEVPDAAGEGVAKMIQVWAGKRS